MSEFSVYGTTVTRFAEVSTSQGTFKVFDYGRIERLVEKTCIYESFGINDYSELFIETVRAQAKAALGIE